VQLARVRQLVDLELADDHGAVTGGTPDNLDAQDAAFSASRCLLVIRVSAARASVMTIREPSRDRERDPAAITLSVYPQLLRLAQAIGYPDSAEDWAQEALIGTLRLHPGYRGIADPSAYTRTVLLRLATKGKLRAKKRTDRELSAVSIPPEDSTSDVAARLHAKELLAELPIRQRACVYLSVVCELSDRDAAKVLGCRPSTVRSNVARALARLKRDSASLFDD
jgi:RNA polymerase sigma factor (sigma-70 family)